MSNNGTCECVSTCDPRNDPAPPVLTCWTKIRYLKGIDAVDQVITSAPFCPPVLLAKSWVTPVQPPAGDTWQLATEYWSTIRSRSAGAVPQFSTALNSADRGEGTKVIVNVVDLAMSTFRVLGLLKYPVFDPVATKATPLGIKILARPWASVVTVWLAPPLTVYAIVTPGRTELSDPLRAININAVPVVVEPEK